MEILIGMVLSVGLEIYKKISNKFGSEVTKVAIYSLLFMASFMWTWAIQNGIISMEYMKSMWAMIASSIATYEVVLKQIDKVINK